MRFYEGVDGLKTGYTASAGYCLTATAKKGSSRFLAVAMGEPDSKTRNQEIRNNLKSTIYEKLLGQNCRFPTIL